MKKYITLKKALLAAQQTIEEAIDCVENPNCFECGNPIEEEHELGCEVDKWKSTLSKIKRAIRIKI